jgi:2,3-dihydroxybenzoate decarboxylase
MPPYEVAKAYYEDYAKDFPLLVRPGWGYTVDTATHAIRLVLSGVFDAYPGLKIILGHFGETLPFLLWRLNDSLQYPGQKKIDFREIFSRNFYVTTSGFFSDPALLCCVMELSVDRILFAVDWPFVMNKPATEWIHKVPLCESDKTKILSGNAKRLLRM